MPVSRKNRVSKKSARKISRSSRSKTRKNMRKMKGGASAKMSAKMSASASSKKAAYTKTKDEEGFIGKHIISYDEKYMGVITDFTENMCVLMPSEPNIQEPYEINKNNGGKIFYAVPEISDIDYDIFITPRTIEEATTNSIFRHNHQQIEDIVDSKPKRFIYVNDESNFSKKDGKDVVDQQYNENEAKLLGEITHEDESNYTVKLFNTIDYGEDFSIEKFTITKKNEGKFYTIEESFEPDYSKELSITGNYIYNKEGKPRGVILQRMQTSFQVLEPKDEKGKINKYIINTQLRVNEEDVKAVLNRRELQKKNPKLYEIFYGKDDKTDKLWYTKKEYDISKGVVRLANNIAAKEAKKAAAAAAAAAVEKARIEAAAAAAVAATSGPQTTEAEIKKERDRILKEQGERAKLEREKQEKKKGEFTSSSQSWASMD